MATVGWSRGGLSTITRATLGLVLLVCLLGFTSPKHAAASSPGDVRWTPVDIPTQGKPGNWVLTRNSDVRHLAVAADGTLYAATDSPETSDTLFQSLDGGHRWSATGNISDTIVALATAAENAGVVCYATPADVYQSSDAAAHFAPLPPHPGGAGSDRVVITTIDVATVNGGTFIAVATADADMGEFGGVYLLDPEQPFTWIDTDIGNYDVYAVTFSPSFAIDHQLVAVVSDETDSYVISKIADGGWGQTIDRSQLGSGIAATAAAIAFPQDYTTAASPTVLFATVVTGSEHDDAYRITSTPGPGVAIVTDLNINGAGTDITSLAVSGSTTLLAGAAGSGQVYLSTDGGATWGHSTKPPTGEARTLVVPAPDFPTSGRAYAATMGPGSAVSCTGDGGITWNQIGFIDTEISSIIDLAPSSHYSQDNTLFLLTWGGEHSLWRRANGGPNWQRVLTTTIVGADSIDRVALSPDYHQSRVIWLAGSNRGRPSIWKSADNGLSYSRHHPPVAVDAWAIVSDDALFIGGFDGTDVLFYSTPNSGWTYSDRVTVGHHPINSIALSPGYEQDGTIVLGNTNGGVYLSTDLAASFNPLPVATGALPLTGSLSVAIDPQYDVNRTVYAASDTADKGIYRLIVGNSNRWQAIDGTLPAGGMIGEIGISAGGTLYAANFTTDGGLERCLNPRFPLGPGFETITRGLDGGAILWGLWLSGNQLWSIDTAHNQLVTLVDHLTTPVILGSPSDLAGDVGHASDHTISNVTLDWETLTGATRYQWQLDFNTDFSSIATGFEGVTTASSVRLPPLETATTYYWRVRASGPVSSPWSATWSFTTGYPPGDQVLLLYSPSAGATGVSRQPVFQWSPLPGAEGYELQIATEVNFTDPVVSRRGEKVLPSTAWQCDTSLDYATTYYWKVTAVVPDRPDISSTVGAFTTESPPATPPAPVIESPLPPAEELPAPIPPPQPAIPDWATWLFYLGGAGLAIMLVLLITVIILTVKISRI